MDNGERSHVEIYIRKPKHGRSDQTFDDQQELGEFLKNQSLFVTLDELVQEHGIDLPLSLSGARRQFRKDNDIVSAVEVMTHCKVMGLYPPPDVMDWVYQAFWDFSKDDEQILGEEVNPLNQFKGDMNKLLGIRGPDRPIPTSLKRARNHSIYGVVGILKGTFGISVRAAAKLVQNRGIKGGEWREAGVPSPEAIEKGYSELTAKPHEAEASNYPFCREHAEDFVDSFDIPEADANVIKMLREQVDRLFPV